MSHSFIDRSSNYFTQKYDNEEIQKKIDPIAQLKELNDNTVREWGLFKNHPAQMFAKEEDVSAEAKAKEEEVSIQGKGIDNENNPEFENEAQAKNDRIGNLEYKAGNIGNQLDDPPLIMARIGCTIGTGGVRLNLNFTVDKKLGDFTASYGFGVTYHSNFYKTGKKGWEMRNSFMLDYNSKQFGASLGTNFWNGFGEMKEFDQRTGMVNLRSG